jgi:hypothetical protein
MSLFKMRGTVFHIISATEIGVFKMSEGPEGCSRLEDFPSFLFAHSTHHDNYFLIINRIM